MSKPTRFLSVVAWLLLASAVRAADIAAPTPIQDASAPSDDNPPVKLYQSWHSFYDNEYNRVCVRQEGDTWVDSTHSYLSENVCGVALWFDRFFADERATAEQVDRYIRVITSAAWNRMDEFDLNVRVSARADFPWFKRKAKLILESESEADARDILSGGRDNAVGDPSLGGHDKQKETTLGIQMNLAEQSSSSFNLTAGLRLSSPAGLKIRARHRYLYHGLGENRLLRFTQQVFWDPALHFGANSRMDWEKILADGSLLRWSTVGADAERNDNGFEWTTSLSLFRHLNDKKAISYNSWVSGHAEPRREVSNFGLSARYRQNIYRDWLFFEIEPSISWRVTDAGSQYDFVPGIIFRVEVQIGRKGAG